MTTLPLSLQFLAAWIGTWIAQHHGRTIAYLKEENALRRDRILAAGSSVMALLLDVLADD